MERIGLHVLAKPTGSACNLACGYCFFRDKASLYPGQRQRMSDDTLATYVRQLFEASAGGPVTVAWQGGEPTLMGLDFFRRAGRLVEENRGPGQEVLNTIQTNATLIDDAWAAFLHEHGYLVGVSIDGPADVHDAYRRDASGAPTHSRVMAAIGRLNAHAVEWNALVAVHRASEGHGRRVYRFLRDEVGARFLQFIPIVERPTQRGVPCGSDVTERSVRPDAYGEFMIEVFDEWVRHDIGTVFVQSFDAALAAWVGEDGAMCIHSAECGASLAMEFNGDVYSCDHFVEPAHLLGNIHDTPLNELARCEQQRAFAHAKGHLLPRECGTCDVESACRGGCPKDRFLPDPQRGPADNYLCAGYRRIFRHVDPSMRRMAALLRAGRAPAELMSEIGPRPATTGP